MTVYVLIENCRSKATSVCETRILGVFSNKKFVKDWLKENTEEGYSYNIEEVILNNFESIHIGNN